MRQVQEFGHYTLTLHPLRLLRGSEPLKLTQRKLETLALLVCARGETVSKEAFFEKVWGGSSVEDGNLTQTVFLLRKTLGKLPGGGEYIETMPRQGYRLAPEAFDRTLFRVGLRRVESAAQIDEPEPAAAPIPSGKPANTLRRRLLWSVAALFAVAALASLSWLTLAVTASARRSATMQPAARAGTVPGLPAGGQADEVSVSHNGRWVAYRLLPEGTLWRSRRDGSGRMRLSPPGRLVLYPQWVPDDRSVVFLSAAAGQPWTVQQVSVRGGPVRTLIPYETLRTEASADDALPSIEEDGTVELPVPPASAGRGGRSEQRLGPPSAAKPGKPMDALVR